MKKQKIILSLLIFFLLPLGLLANRTSVELSVPDTAEAGEVITVKIEVSHRGNSSRHFTDWVYLKINDEEVKRWEYSSSERPDNQNFTLEFELEIESTVEIEAQGNCNIHGGAGAVKKTIVVN